MAKLVRCVLANLEHTLPMPDRGYHLFPQSEHGRVVDVEKPFYRAALNDGSILRHPDPKAAEDALAREAKQAAVEAASAANTADNSTNDDSSAGDAGARKPAKGAKS